jgi:hypothetical protein
MINEYLKNELPKELLAALPTKQLRIDVGEPELWQQLPELDRQACCNAIVAMLCIVITSEIPKHQSFSQQADNDER